MQDFRTLKVWEKAHALTLAVYAATRRFPADELYGLTSQLRRSCVSIASNIAEGCGRGGSGDLSRFLSIAAGSASEAEYQILLAHDLQLLDELTHQRLTTAVSEVKQMLASLMRRVRSAGDASPAGTSSPRSPRSPASPPRTTPSEHDPPF